MQTIHDSQLLDPQVREADSILRKCVHCGFCTDMSDLCHDRHERRHGRIWLMRRTLKRRSVSKDTGFHLDRCLGCLAANDMPVRR